MNLPLYMNDFFGYNTGLVLATLLGFGFGFTLERSGFGRASIMAAQFYFTNTRVLKVMFSAIVTALLGMTVLSGIGVLDFGAIRVPETFLWPQLLGGLLLGAGFIISGYCPGTGIVAISSGKFDGLFAIFGVMVGSVLFGFGFPLYADFYTSGALGVVRLPDLLGVPQAWLAVGVTLMAIGAFLGAEKAERAVAARSGSTPPPSDPGIRRRAFVGLAIIAIVGLGTLAVPPPEMTVAGPSVRTIDSRELARILIELPESIFLVDTRVPAAPLAEQIPGSIVADEGDTEFAFVGDLPGTRTLVIFGEGDLESVPAGVDRFEGTIATLEGGFDQFRRTILSEPVMPDPGTPEEVANYKLLSALHAKFTGAKVKSDAPPPRPVKVKRAPPKKGGGC